MLMRIEMTIPASMIALRMKVRLFFGLRASARRSDNDSA
jgi:hypothetical protein